MGDNFAISLDGLRSEVFARAILREKLEKRSASQVFLKVCAVVQIFRINFRNGQTVPPEVAGKFQERDVLFAHVIENPNRAMLCAGEPGDVASGAAELALQRLYI